MHCATHAACGQGLCDEWPVRHDEVSSGATGVDLQACGGTHVARSGEIGRVECIKVENKGKMNRRFIIALA